MCPGRYGRSVHLVPLESRHAEAILAGAVETIEGRQIGRLRFSVDSVEQAKELISALKADGIYAEEAA